MDNRFIYEFNDQTFDLSNIEVCIDKSSEAKVYNNKERLTREGKTNNPVHIMLLNNSNRIHIGVIQVFVLKTYFFTVRYVENNLFVVISQFEVNISTCNDQLESFIKDLSELFTFQKYAELLAHAANAKLETVCNDRDSNTLKKLLSIFIPAPFFLIQ